MKLTIFPFLLIPHYFQLKEIEKPFLYSNTLKFNFIMDKRLFGYFFISIQGVEKKIVESITNTEFLRVLLGKKIHIQYKGLVEEQVFDCAFFYASKGNMEFILAINNEIIKNLLDYFDVDDISLLEKKLYAILTNPVADIDKYILALPDNKLQLLLNHILSKRIASIDMLAGYIRNLGERGDRILKNFSTRVRTELTEKIRSYSTYRWAREVNYIINRNILVSAGELMTNLPFFSRFEYIKKAYHIAVLQNEFENRINEEGQKPQKGIKFEEINKKYNENKFSPLDGELIKACDKLAAFIEANLSIEYGITSKYLEEGRENIYNPFKNRKISGTDFGRIFDYFYKKQW